jgi:maleate cis-trans isomerase
MEGIDVPFTEVQRLSSQEVYMHTKQAFLKHQDADAIYMLGSGWRVMDIIALLEQDLEVPVIHPVPARAWEIMKRLHVREPVAGYGQLLEILP